MSRTKRFIVTVVFAALLLALSVILPQLGHADTYHYGVTTSVQNTSGNYQRYQENKNNAGSGGVGNARVTIMGWITYLNTQDWQNNDIYGTEIYAYHYGAGQCNCWSVDASQAAGNLSVSTANESGQPCEWVLWYAWDGSTGPNPPVFSGNFC